MRPRVLVVQHQDDCPPALLGDWLVEAGCELDVRRSYAGDDLPADLRDHDVLLVLGGSMGANDDDTHAWFADTKALIREADVRRTPTLGICLGHQLAAVALGGEVERNPLGQQLGLLPMGWTAEASRDDMFRALVKTPCGIQWNDDLVTALPKGTVVLAKTECDEVQVARFAPSVWGVQLHPEVDEHILAAWAAEDPDRYATGVLEDVLARIVDAREELETGWRLLAQALAAMG